MAGASLIRSCPRLSILCLSYIAACLFWMQSTLLQQPSASFRKSAIAFWMAAMQVAKWNSIQTPTEKKPSLNFCNWVRQELCLLVTDAIWERHYLDHSAIEDPQPAAGRWVFTWRFLGCISHCWVTGRIAKLTWCMTFSKLKIYPILMALYEQEIAALAFWTMVLVL